MNKELLTKIEELETRIKTLEQLLESEVEDIMIDEPLEEELPEGNLCGGDGMIEGGNCFIDNDDPEDPEEPTDEDIDIDREIEREEDRDD